MAFYFAFIFAIALVTSLAAALNLYLVFFSDNPYSSKDYSIEIAALAFESANMIIFAFLHFMMLVLYYKFSKLKHGMTAMTLDRVT